MMRSADRIATAVRKPDGEVLVKIQPYLPITRRIRYLGIPILRGAIAFFEMLIIGIRTLNFSADIAIVEAEKADKAAKGEAPDTESKRTNLSLALTALLALGLGVGIFFFLPLAIAGLFGIDKNAVGFNLLAGAVRLLMFVAYVWVISRFKEFQRIFQYHGAEHKSIYAYEMGETVSVENAARYTRFHPRCGTSFILIVALLAILIYAIADSIYALQTGHPPALLTRFGIHFALLPLIAGTSYELLKLSGKTRDNAVTKILIAPGLWMQRLTTAEPSADQLEVAVIALQASLGVSAPQVSSKVTALS